MDKVLSFVWEYRFILLVLFAIVLYAIFDWQRFKTKAYAVMLQAKRLAKDAVLKSGAEQEEWVVKKLLQLLPKTWIIFITEERLRKIVKYLYNKAKDYCDDGKINNSI